MDLSIKTSLTHSSIDELTPSSYPTQDTLKLKVKKCNECKKKRKLVNETHRFVVYAIKQKQAN
jgi:hypothetical protein